MIFHARYFRDEFFLIRDLLFKGHLYFFDLLFECIFKLLVLSLIHLQIDMLLHLDQAVVIQGVEAHYLCMQVLGIFGTKFESRRSL
jgi:hypothetical protein